MVTKRACSHAARRGSSQHRRHPATGRAFACSSPVARAAAARVGLGHRLACAGAPGAARDQNGRICPGPQGTALRGSTPIKVIEPRHGGRSGTVDIWSRMDGDELSRRSVDVIVDFGGKAVCTRWSRDGTRRGRPYRVAIWSAPRNGDPSTSGQRRNLFAIDA